MLPHAPVLGRFTITPPRYEWSQADALGWLTEAHAQAQDGLAPMTPAARGEFTRRLGRLLERCGCPPDKIARRGSCLADVGRQAWADNTIYDLAASPHGQGTAARSRVFADVVAAYFEASYADEELAPRDLVHVTCTGYVAPSGAQRMVAQRGWGALTRVVHAYHMGCYAALPAIRIAAGFAATTAPEDVPAGAAARVDLVHTELCSLHLDPSDHEPEQLVVQSLFADGFIRYSLELDGEGPGLRLLGLGERILPASADAMTWVVADHGTRMTLSRHVPAKIGAAVAPFVAELCARAGRAPDEQGVIFAVHPGGPRIIDAVQDLLRLDGAQVRASRDVLHDHGNMSSATLPHVWKRLADDPSVPSGTLIVSLAFGPGLTICGGLFEKV